MSSMVAKLTAATTTDLWLGLLRFHGTAKFFQQCLSLCSLSMVSFEVPSHFYVHSFSVYVFLSMYVLSCGLSLFFPILKIDFSHSPSIIFMCFQANSGGVSVSGCINCEVLFFAF